MVFRCRESMPFALFCFAICCLILTGCAGAPKEDFAQGYDADSYYARSLPGLSDSTGGDGQWASPVRRALLEEHASWAGTPYRLGGDDRYGVDCSALVQNIFRNSFRLSLPRTTTGQVNQGRPVKKAQLHAGDLVFFRPPGPYKHVGIYVGDGYFLHASTSQGVKLSRLDNRYWQRYYWQSRRPLARDQLAALVDR